MKWLKRIICKWIREDWEQQRTNEFAGIETLTQVSNSSIDASGFRLNVFKARGGTVIETNVYDNVKSRNHQSLYVVTDDKDLGNELGKIITMENLRA